jgi:hypothetical protein
MAQDIPEIVRERYYDNQLLHVQDFEREHTFHVAQRELQTRLFYTPGVLAGLGVQNGGAGKVLVFAGVAIDGMGQLIILARGAKFGGSSLTAQDGVFTLDLNKDPSPYPVGRETRWLLTAGADPRPDANENQWIERPVLSLVPADAGPGASQIVLARVEVKATEKTDTTSGRPVTTITLAVQVELSVQMPATLSPERVPVVSADKIKGKLEPGVIPDLDAGQIKSGKLNPALIPDLSADRIRSGKLAVDLIPDLDAAQIKTGKLNRSVIPTLGADSIPDLDADKIKTGTLSARVLPDLDAGQIKSGKLGIAQIPDIPADKIGSGKLNASVLPGLDASQITSGVLSADRLPPDFLPPDQTKPKWQATIARPGGDNNRVRFLLDAYGFVHLSGTISPVFSKLKAGTDDLLQLPAVCTPGEIQIFRILDSRGEPWQLNISTTAGKSITAIYLAPQAEPKPGKPDLSLSLTGLSYALKTSST